MSDEAVATKAPAAEGKPVAAQPLDTPAEKPVEEAPVDNRQRWYCVDPYGPKTQCRDFKSDDHLNVNGPPVVCPSCGSRSVMRADQWDTAHPPTKPRDPRVPSTNP